MWVMMWEVVPQNTVNYLGMKQWDNSQRHSASFNTSYRSYAFQNAIRPEIIVRTTVGFIVCLRNVALLRNIPRRKGRFMTRARKPKFRERVERERNSLRLPSRRRVDYAQSLHHSNLQESFSLCIKTHKLALLKSAQHKDNQSIEMRANQMSFHWQGGNQWELTCVSREADRQT